MRSLLRKVTNRKVEYPLVAYSINSIETNLLEMLLNTEELFGFEVYNQNISCIVPSILKLDSPLIEREPLAFEDVEYFEVELTNPSFLPLYTKETINLIDTLTNIEVDDGLLFTQILVEQHKGNWRDKLINQYEAYLLGNENPLSNNSLRNIQTKLYKLVDRIGNFETERSPIPEVEEKILQPNYHMEIRFLVKSEKSKEIIENVTKIAKKLTFFNEINIFSIKNNASFMEDVRDRKLSTYYNNTYFSQSEILSIFSSNKINSIPKATNTISSYSPTQAQDTSELSSLLPYPETTARNIDNSLGKLIESAFHRVNITKSKLKIQSIEQGATLQKVSVTIPKDTNFMKIEKNMKNIQATLGKEEISVEIGDKPETINFYVPSGEREVVYLGKLLNTEKWKEFSNESALPFIIGEDTIGKPLFADLQKLVHILITGTTGSGKSVFLNSLILSLLLSKQSNELIFYLIDPKQVELAAFDGFPHVKEVITDMNKANNVMYSLIKEMERRYSLFSKAGVRNLEQYNKNAENTLPYICCIIDEFADLMETNKELESVIQRLGQKARASGIHLVIATQRPSVDVITGVIKSNLPSTFCLRLKTSVDYKTVFNKGIPYKLLGNGDGVAAIEGNVKEFERFQSPVISLDDNEVIEIFDKMKKRMGEGSTDGIELVEQETQLEKLKRIIATTGETRIAELRKIMSIRTNVVSDLMKELVEDRWVEMQGRSFVITADEEELNVWRE